MSDVSRTMAEVGADGINFDTTASAGDAEFLATLQAVEELATTTDLAIEVGMAAELVLGFHGELEYEGTRLAGLWPHQQLKVVEQAGAHIFGPVVNTNTRQVDALERRSRLHLRQGVLAQAASIPIHANVGMGVGGVPIVRGAAHRRRHARPASPWSRSAGSTACRWARGDPFGMSHQPRARLGHGRHPHHRRPGGADAAPQDEAAGGQALRGRQARRERARPDRLDPDAPSARGARHRRRSPPCRARAKGLEAKARIAELLGVEIPSVQKLAERVARRPL